MATSAHNGGKPAAFAVGDAAAIIAPRDERRLYLEIQNDADGARMHISISDVHDAEFGVGLYLDPGSVYAIPPGLITHARITGVCATGTTTTLYTQVGY